MGVSPVKMLFWAAVLNGALAPPLVALITLLTSDCTVMDARVSSLLLRWLGWMTCALITAGSGGGRTGKGGGGGAGEGIAAAATAGPSTPLPSRLNAKPVVW